MSAMELAGLKNTSQSRSWPRGVYAGSFDPVTAGHLSVIERAVGLFAELFVVVAVNPDKRSLFRLAERVRGETDVDQRIFVRAADELTRFRLAWFLRPRNVLPRVPDTVWFQTGDRILLYEDAVGVRRARAGRFPRRADAVRVEVLWQDGATALLEVR